MTRIIHVNHNFKFIFMFYSQKPTVRSVADKSIFGDKKADPQAVMVGAEAADQQNIDGDEATDK